MLRLLFVSCLWAFSFGINKQWVAGADPVLVTLIRLCLALLTLLPWLRLPLCGRSGIHRLLVIGAVQYGVMYIALNYCFIVMHAYQVALFTILTPLYVAVIHAWRSGRRPWRLFAAAALSLLGAALAESWHFDRRTFWEAFGVMQISNAAFAWGQVAYKDWRAQRPLEDDARIFGWLYLGGVIVSLAWALLRMNWHEPLYYSFSRWMALLYLGIAASGAGFYLWNTGATQVKPGVLAVLNNLKSPLAVLVSVLFWGTTVNMDAGDWSGLILGTLCIAGAALMALRTESAATAPAIKKY